MTWPLADYPPPPPPCARCLHRDHRGSCDWPITETICDDVGFAGPPSYMRRTIMVAACDCDHPLPEGAEVCGVEWDDRDDPTIPRGHGHSCALAWEHDGPHRQDGYAWEK